MVPISRQFEDSPLPMQSGEQDQRSGWDAAHGRYTCVDATAIDTPRATFEQKKAHNFRDMRNILLGVRKQEKDVYYVPRNGISYQKST